MLTAVSTQRWLYLYMNARLVASSLQRDIWRWRSDALVTLAETRFCGVGVSTNVKCLNECHPKRYMRSPDFTQETNGEFCFFAYDP